MNLYQKKIWNIFTKKNKLVITNETNQFLLKVGEEMEDFESFLEKTALNYKKEIKDHFVDLNKLQSIINKTEHICKENIKNNILDIFSLINYQYDKKNKTFIPSDKKTNNLKTKKTFKERYFLLKEVALDFIEEQGVPRKITTIKNIEYNKNNFVFGWLFKKKGRFYLEDEKGEIEIDFSKSQYYKEEKILLNSFVLITGFEKDDILVSTWIKNLPIGFVRKRFCNNFFNETKNKETDFFLFFSGIFMDDNIILDKFEKCLETFEQTKNIPMYIFLLGPFFNKPLSLGKKCLEQKSLFCSFIERIGKYPTLKKETYFFLIPNANDPFQTILFPRGPIPSIFFEKTFSDRTKIKISSLSNPTKISVFGKNISFVSKNNKTEKQISLMNNTCEITMEDYLHSMLIQACFSVGEEKNVFCWEKANDLTMFPYPDLLVLSDEKKSFSGEIGGTKYIKVGSLSETTKSFFSVSFNSFMIKEHSF